MSTGEHASSSTFEHCDPLPKRKEDAKRQLQMLLAGGTGWLVITTIFKEVLEDGTEEKTILSRSFEGDAINVAVAYAMRQSESHDVYVGTGLRSRPFNGTAARGGYKDIASVSAICVEVDWKDPAHKEQALPPSREAALALIEEFPCKPTGIIDSGHGLHGWWKLSEPLIITDETSRKAAQELVAGFHQAFRQPFTQRGYKLDSTHSLASIMRVAGTVNRKKPDALKSVTVVRWDDAISYKPSDLPQAPPAAKQSKPKTEQTNKKSRTKRKKADKTSAYPPADFDAVVTGCPWLQHVRDDAATLPEPEWHAAATLAVNCTDGRKHFHEISKPYPGYEDGEADLKLDRAEDVGPVKCSTIRDKYNGEAYCSRCPFLGGIVTPVELGRPADGKPINTSHGDVPEQTAKAWAALYGSNTPPTLFRLAEGLARLDRGGDGVLTPTVLKADHLTHRVSRVVPWTRTMQNGAVKGAQVPDAVVRDMLVEPLPPLPLLTGISQVPVFSKDGSLQQSAGYSRRTGRYLDPRGLVVPAISSHPTPAQIKAAVDLIHELVADFPFVKDADRAHTYALALLPFGRDFIDGPTPLHLIDKPVHGTGATLLAQTVMIPTVGHHLMVRSAPKSDEEWRKSVTSALIEMPAAILLDNLSGRIDSPSLSMALTAPTWTDRLLGASRNVRVPVTLAWVATGNNVQLSGELSRRSVPIRLDAKTDRPWEREHTFKHPNLLQWANHERGRLVAALLTLWSAWLDAGCPAGKGVLGSYESWVSVIGGVLEVAGIDGFLQGMDAHYDRADAEGAAHHTFVEEWWERWGSDRVTATDLLAQAIVAELPLHTFGDQQAAELGTLLRTLRDRRYELDSEGKTVTVMVTSTYSGKKNLWRLTVVS